MLRRRMHLLAALLLLAAAPLAHAQAPVAYRLSFPERAHRIMHVEVTFQDVPPGPLQVRMSRASPGRYALHEFAKNVLDVQAVDEAGRPLQIVRATPHQWDIAGHTGTVRLTYRIFGDRVDGTYLAIDDSHAHINMPAALMWARGLEARPATVRFEPPPGAGWRVATQLVVGTDAFSFNAPNLQYLMDSPAEFSRFALRTFTVPDDSRTPVFRVAVHHTGSDADVDGLVRAVEAIVREARQVFREFPVFETNTYTFIADYLPWAPGDGMEHRNSTILTSGSSIASARADLLDTIAHEFFHAWNVERIRPRSLEPFDFSEANMSGELWLAEGVTSYFGPLIAHRADVASLDQFVREMSGVVATVVASPGRQLRSAVEMSQQAPFVDAASSTDRTAVDNAYISYYTWGAAIGLGLDLTLRDRSDGRVTLDDFMRMLWARHGKASGGPTGSVARPYTMDDLKVVLAEVSGDAAFAQEFFARYIEGREVVDYARLLARAGLVLRPVAPGRASMGTLRVQEGPGGVRLTAASPFGSPLYAAGLDREDVITSLGGRRVTSLAEIERVLGARKAGETLEVAFERRGQTMSASVTLVEDARREIVTAESAGQPVSDAQRRFRGAWLGSGARNTF